MPDHDPLAVVDVAPSDEPEVGRLLARAFADDPIFVFVEPARAPRLEFLERFMAALTLRSRLYATALRTAPELAGVSLWKGPDLREMTPEQLAETGLDRIDDWLTAAAAARFESLFDAVEATLDADVPGPRWYLGVLGVVPERQGRGLGSRLLQPILEQADRDCLPVTLETAQPRNLPLYQRHGFRILRELPPVAPGAPVVWTMRRPPSTTPGTADSAGPR